MFRSGRPAEKGPLIHATCYGRAIRQTSYESAARFIFGEQNLALVFDRGLQMGI
jgi:hypothetical protein